MKGRMEREREREGYALGWSQSAAWRMDRERDENRGRERGEHTVAVYQGYWAIRHTLHSYATPNELLFLATKCFSSSSTSLLLPLTPLSLSLSLSLSPLIHSTRAISWRVIPIILEISTVDWYHGRPRLIALQDRAIGTDISPLPSYPLCPTIFEYLSALRFARVIAPPSRRCLYPFPGYIEYYYTFFPLAFGLFSPMLSSAGFD